MSRSRARFETTGKPVVSKLTINLTINFCSQIKQAFSLPPSKKDKKKKVCVVGSIAFVCLRGLTELWCVFESINFDFMRDLTERWRVIGSTCSVCEITDD